MGAVEKATMALRETGIPFGQRERLARIVLAAVGHEVAVAEWNRLRLALVPFVAEVDEWPEHVPFIETFMEREDWERARAALDAKP